MKAEELGAWQALLQEELEKPYWRTLSERVDAAYAAAAVYPPREALFAAFRLTPPEAVRAVILGQDPYHEPGQANGLCFSVNDGTPLPPSLQNIYKEIADDTGVAPYPSGNLRRWSDQGVLLLNSTLTVGAGQAGSHQGRGWEEFTDAVIRHLSDEREGIVFLLWGNYARRKGASIDRSKHLVLESAHPSPLSAHRGFFGNHHFSRANDYLRAHGLTPIDWR